WSASSTTAKAWNLGLKSLGLEKEITPEQVESVTGNPNEDCIEQLLPELKEKYPTLLKVLDTCERKFIQSEGGVLYEGVVEGIKELAKRHSIFLVSNCQDWYLDQFFIFSGLRNTIVDSDCHGLSQMTKTEMLKRMREKHMLKNPVYIGDTTGDMDSARQASIEFIGVSYGFGQMKSEKIFDSFPSLLEYLEK